MEDTGDAEAGEPRMNAKGREFNHNHGLNARAAPEGRTWWWPLKDTGDAEAGEPRRDANLIRITGKMPVPLRRAATWSGARVGF
jgi:hypothetical protein